MNWVITQFTKFKISLKQNFSTEFASYFFTIFFFLVVTQLHNFHYIYVCLCVSRMYVCTTYRDDDYDDANNKAKRKKKKNPSSMIRFASIYEKKTKNKKIKIRVAHIRVDVNVIFNQHQHQMPFLSFLSANWNLDFVFCIFIYSIRFYCIQMCVALAPLIHTKSTILRLNIPAYTHTHTHLAEIEQIIKSISRDTLSLFFFANQLDFFLFFFRIIFVHDPISKRKEKTKKNGSKIYFK